MSTKNEREKKVPFKQITEDFFANASMHGLSKIVSAENFISKIIWTLVTLVGLALVIYTIVTNMIIFFQYGYSYSSATRTDEINSFPAVTICNLYQFNFKDNTVFLESILNQGTFQSGTVTNVEELSRQNQLKSDFLKANMKSLSRSSNQTYIQSKGYKFSDIVMSCTFNGKLCGESDFTFSYSYEYGNCYTFNKQIIKSQTPLTIDNAGPSFGLDMELYSGAPSIQDRLSLRSGFYVAVHNNSETLLTNYKGNFIQVGAATYIGVTKQIVNRLSAPYTNCTETVDEESITTDHNVLKQAIDNGYSINGCLELCKQKYFYQIECSCQNAGLSLFSGEKICKDVSEILCVNSLSRSLKQNEVHAVCGSICPKPCTDYNYQETLSSSSYPTHYYASLLKETTLLNSTDYDTLKATIANLKVYMKRLQYQKIDQVPVLTLIDLLSSIGGFLGLFIGMSILSIFEVIEYGMKIIIAIFKNSEYSHKCTIKNIGNKINVRN